MNTFHLKKKNMNHLWTHICEITLYNLFGYKHPKLTRQCKR